MHAILGDTLYPLSVQQLYGHELARTPAQRSEWVTPGPQ